MDARMYINFYFKELEHIDDYVTGVFSAPDNDVECRFKWLIGENYCDIWDNNKSIEEIGMIPVWWLMKKLRENGRLEETECKISY